MLVQFLFISQSNGEILKKTSSQIDVLSIRLLSFLIFYACVFFLYLVSPFHTSNKIVRILLLIIKNNAFPPLFAGAAREERKSTYDEL